MRMCADIHNNNWSYRVLPNSLTLISEDLFLSIIKTSVSNFLRTIVVLSNIRHVYLWTILISVRNEFFMSLRLFFIFRQLCFFLLIKLSFLFSALLIFISFNPTSRPHFPLYLPLLKKAKSIVLRPSLRSWSIIGDPFHQVRSSLRLRTVRSAEPFTCFFFLLTYFVFLRAFTFNVHFELCHNLMVIFLLFKRFLSVERFSQQSPLLFHLFAFTSLHEPRTFRYISKFFSSFLFHTCPFTTEVTKQRQEDKDEENYIGVVISYVYIFLVFTTNNELCWNIFYHL